MRKSNLLLILAEVFHLPLFARQKVNGRVTAADGSVLPGVDIRLKGDQLAIQTDKHGKFRLAIPQDAVLIFSHTGYDRLEIAVGKQTGIRVQMQLAGQNPGKVVVISCGTQKSWDLTGSVACPIDTVMRN